MKDLSDSFEEIVKYRRAVRRYKSDFDVTGAVFRSLQRAQLAPSSSNMQMWEFYWIKEKENLKSVSVCCMSQQTTETASQILVLVIRPDLWKSRAVANLDHIKNTVGDRRGFRGKSAVGYYSHLMPLLYNNDRLGFRSLIKRIYVGTVGLFRPMVREVSKQDVRVILHKSAALAAQTFMLSMASEGLDTCPVEGFDSVRLKKLLKLPKRAEICLVITCGKRETEGVFGERYRIPFNESYHER
jgi:nitroreductase